MLRDERKPLLVSLFNRIGISLTILTIILGDFNIPIVQMGKLSLWDAREFGSDMHLTRVPVGGSMIPGPHSPL